MENKHKMDVLHELWLEKQKGDPFFEKKYVWEVSPRFFSDLRAEQDRHNGGMLIFNADKWTAYGWPFKVLVEKKPEAELVLVEGK